MISDWLNYHRAFGYFFEIFIAEFLFVHSFKKRGHFLVRLIVFLAIAMPVMSFVDLYRNTSTVLRLAYLLTVIVASILGMLLLYDTSPSLLVASCVAGIATQHIGNKALTLFLLIPTISKFTGSSLGYIVCDVLVLFAVYLVIYLLVARDYSPKKSSGRLNVVSLMIVIICIGVNRLVVDHTAENIYYEIASCIYAIICCGLAIAMQLYLYRWQEEKTESSVIKELLSASEKQY